MREREREGKKYCIFEQSENVSRFYSHASAGVCSYVLRDESSPHPVSSSCVSLIPEEGEKEREEGRSSIRASRRASPRLNFYYTVASASAASAVAES